MCKEHKGGTYRPTAPATTAGNQPMTRTRAYLAAAMTLIVVAVVIVIIAIAFTPGDAPDHKSLLLALNDFPDGYTAGAAMSSAEAARYQRPDPQYNYQPTTCTESFATRADQTLHTSRVGFVAEAPSAAAPQYSQYLIRNDYDQQRMRNALLNPVCAHRTVDTHASGLYSYNTSELPLPQALDSTPAIIVRETADITNPPADTADHFETVAGYSWLPSGLLVSLVAEVYGRGNTVDMSQFNNLFVKATKNASR